MGVAGYFPDSDIEDQREELVRQHFEPQLSRLDLSAEQIEEQDLDQLNHSLVRVNDAILHPDNFGTLKLRFSPGAGFFVVTGLKGVHTEIGILPLLLERKSLILSRIRALGAGQETSNLNKLLVAVADPQLRTELESEVSNLAERSRQLTEQESGVAQAQAKQIAKRDKAVAKLRAELLERKLRAWTGFFAKESMATFIGALLVLVLTFVQLAPMFPGVPHTPEIINNAYLLLLGYFFGQGVAQKSARQES